MSVPPSERGQIPLKDTLSAIRKLNEGKTKIIWETPNPNFVLIESKDDITAGDGERRDIIAGKAELATETTQNCFRYLNSRGVPTHYIGPYNATTFIAERATMIPIELVARRVAFGSYLRRNPDAIEGQVFPEIELEFFYKDDAGHDPMMIQREDGLWELHDAKKPFSTGLVDVKTPKELGIEDLKEEEVDLLRGLTARTFTELEAAWVRQGVTLVDLKIECGRVRSGQIKVADVVDNDSGRIWPGGVKSRMLDKQVYRDITKPDPKGLALVKGNYARVAQMTREF